MEGEQPQAATQTKCILRFLWHDLTSIVGQYFTSCKSVDSDFVVDCVLDQWHSQKILLGEADFKKVLLW